MFAKIYDSEIKIDYNNADGFNRYLDDIILGGLAEIPATSTLYEAVMKKQLIKQWSI